MSDLKGESSVDTTVKIGYEYGGNVLYSGRGCENLHQESVEIFDCSEDSDKGLHVLAKRGKQLLVDEDMSGNPSYRRQGLQINFSCECCEGEARLHTLNIVQHKGSTLMFWSE